MTISGDMSIVLHDEINSMLGPQAHAKWEEYCLELEIASFPKWKGACELWSQPGWIAKRVSLAVESRAEIARQQAFAPAMVAPTMAMSLDQPITIDLPTHILEPEPVSPPSSQASPQSSQPQTGEHAAELTPDAALVQLIAELSLSENLSDSETVVTMVPPRRRASVGSGRFGTRRFGNKMAEDVSATFCCRNVFGAETSSQQVKDVSATFCDFF